MCGSFSKEWYRGYDLGWNHAVKAVTRLEEEGEELRRRENESASEKEDS
jgi:hypothetical protein